MSAQLSLASPEHYERLAPLVEAYDVENGVAHDAVARRDTFLPLMEGSPLGAIYIIGPVRAPIGYLVLTLTWSMAFGGIEASVKELYVRPAVRGRGIGSEALTALVAPLREAGVKALSIEMDPTDSSAQEQYTRDLFRHRPSQHQMVRKL